MTIKKGKGITVEGVTLDPAAGKTVGLAEDRATGRTRLYVGGEPAGLLEPGAVVDQALVDRVRTGRAPAPPVELDTEMIRGAVVECVENDARAGRWITPPRVAGYAAEATASSVGAPLWERYEQLLAVVRDGRTVEARAVDLLIGDMVFSFSSWSARFAVAFLPLLSAEGGVSAVEDPERFGRAVRTAVAAAGEAG